VQAGDATEPSAAPEGADARPAAVLPALGSGARGALLELLKYGLLEESAKPNLYRLLRLHRDALDAALGLFDLALRVDEVRGLAFVVVASGFDGDEDEWSHPLVRRQRLTLEQSLLLAILRQQFVAHEVEAGVGAGGAQVALEDLLPHLQAYLGDLRSDALERKRLLALLEQLKGHGIVSDVDQQERVTIRPIIAHIANPENLTGLLQALREAAGEADDIALGADEDAE
jgi:hypothetical protein